MFLERSNLGFCSLMFAQGQLVHRNNEKYTFLQCIYARYMCFQKMFFSIKKAGQIVPFMRGGDSFPPKERH